MLRGSCSIDNKNEVLAHSTTYETPPLQFLVADVHIQHIKMCAKWIVCSVGIFKTRQKSCAAKPVFGQQAGEGDLSTHKTTKRCHQEKRTFYFLLCRICKMKSIQCSHAEVHLELELRSNFFCHEIILEFFKQNKIAFVGRLSQFNQLV